MIRFFMDEETINQLQDEIREIKERLMAIEKDQRVLREDILSGNAIGRMKKRMLENPKEKMNDKKERIESQIKIEI